MDAVFAIVLMEGSHNSSRLLDHDFSVLRADFPQEPDAEYKCMEQCVLSRIGIDSEGHALGSGGAGGGGGAGGAGGDGNAFDFAGDGFGGGYDGGGAGQRRMADVETEATNKRARIDEPPVGGGGQTHLSQFGQTPTPQR